MNQNRHMFEHNVTQALCWMCVADAAVKVEHGCFSWEGDEEQASWRLEDIELTIPHGQLVALVGSVGAGKSSILSALLGEMKKDAGKVVINVSDQVNLPHFVMTVLVTKK